MEQRGLVWLLGEVGVKGGWVERMMNVSSFWWFTGSLCEEVKGGRLEKGDRGRRRESRRKRKRTGN
jgi:hypothetical protein